MGKPSRSVTLEILFFNLFLKNLFFNFIKFGFVNILEYLVLICAFKALDIK